MNYKSTSQQTPSESRSLAFKKPSQKILKGKNTSFCEWSLINNKHLSCHYRAILPLIHAEMLYLKLFIFSAFTTSWHNELHRFSAVLKCFLLFVLNLNCFLGLKHIPYSIIKLRTLRSSHSLTYLFNT